MVLSCFQIRCCCVVGAERGALCSDNGNLSVNKPFRRKLSNVGHLRISEDECCINNHLPACLCVCACVCGRWRFVHVRL